MRAYVPLGWARLVSLRDHRQLAGPLRACVVDPSWRAGSPEVDEEQWEFEAQSAAAGDLADEGGAVLAVDLDGDLPSPEDGWLVLAGPILLADARAVLSAELAWYGVQEIGDLLATR